MKLTVTTRIIIGNREYRRNVKLCEMNRTLPQICTRTLKQAMSEQ